jgi:putative ABC transport system permease protein
VVAADDRAIVGVLGLQRVSGEVTTAPADGALVGQPYAKANGLALGDVMALTYASGVSVDLRVAGIYQANQLAGDLVVNSAQRASFSFRYYQVAFIDKDPDVSASDVRGAIDAALAPYPTIDVQDQSQYIAQQNAQIDQVLGIFQGLLALAIVIAGIGILNTLALSVLERTRELGMLRAIGMSRRQVKRMVRVEAVVIAVFGAALGIVVGVGFGIALQRGLRDQGIARLALPWAQLAFYVAACAVIGVLAALIPARRASRLNVLAAIKAE